MRHPLLARRDHRSESARLMRPRDPRSLGGPQGSCSDGASARRRLPRQSARPNVTPCSRGSPSGPSTSAHSWGWPRSAPGTSRASATSTAATRSGTRPRSPPSSRPGSARNVAMATARAISAASSSSRPRSSRRCVARMPRCRCRSLHRHRLPTPSDDGGERRSCCCSPRSCCWWAGSAHSSSSVMASASR